jgi:DNA-binding MltR family transcriptional regulator
MPPTDLEDLYKKVELLEQAFLLSIKQLPKESQERVLKVFEFRRSLSEETDRGCVLMAAAFLDDRLRVLIQSFLIQDAKVQKQVFDMNGALGAFSSRIDFAFLLGLIPQAAHGDLHLLRKIRNEFAHNSAPIKLVDEPIKSICANLKLHTLSAKYRPRAKVTRVLMALLVIIDGKVYENSPLKTPEPFDISFIETLFPRSKELGDEGGLRDSPKNKRSGKNHT